MSELLKQQEYHELEETTRLLTRCRRDVVEARVSLGTNRALTGDQRRDLWRIVDAREWFMKMVAKDYTGELEQIDRELEAELSR